MTDELSRQARDLLDAARGGDEPSAADQARVRARVMAAVGAGAAAGGASGAGGVSAAKLGAALVLAGALVGAAYLALRGGGGRASAPAPAVTRAEPRATPELAPTPTLKVPPAPEEEPGLEPEPEIEAVPEVAAPPRAPAHRPAARDAAPPADTLAAERALLAKATTALRGGDPAAALAALDEHQRRFPRGVLVEERSAARVLALCAAGRDADGAKAKAAFLARWPQSVHAARVRAACE